MPKGKSWRDIHQHRPTLWEGYTCQFLEKINVIHFWMNMEIFLGAGYRIQSFPQHPEIEHDISWGKEGPEKTTATGSTQHTLLSHQLSWRSSSQRHDIPGGPVGTLGVCLTSHWWHQRTGTRIWCFSGLCGEMTILPINADDGSLSSCWQSRGAPWHIWNSKSSGLVA